MWKHRHRDSEQAFRATRDSGIACDAGEKAARFTRAAANPAGARTISVQNERATREPLFRSPSRFRFRPPAPMTFGFRLLPSLPASTYLRSVLGAKRNLGEVKAVGKRSEFEKDAICTDSIIHISTADLAACGNVPERLG